MQFGQMEAEEHLPATSKSNQSNQPVPVISASTRNHLAHRPVHNPLDYNCYSPDDIRYYIYGYILHHRSQRHSPKTIAACKERLSRFVWFLQKEGYPTELQHITPNHIRHFLIYLDETKEGRWDSSHPLANRPLSQNSIHTYAKTLKAFFRWATKEAALPRNPFDNVDMPRLPNQWQVQTYTDEEIEALFAAVERTGGGHPFIVQRNRAILAILLDSGLRASELLSLKVADIDVQQGVFIVTGKGRKSRTVATGSFARRQLWAYLRYRLRMSAPEAALFVTRQGTPLTYAGLRLMFRRLRELTGIQRVSVRAHNCRHTAASIMHRNGMRGSTLQEILGHASFDTTRRYYLNIRPEDIRREHEMYSPLDAMSTRLKRGYGRPLPSEAGGYPPEGGAYTTHRPDLPPADVLLREVVSTSYRAVARKYGVSDTAIRKRLKKAGLITG